MYFKSSSNVGASNIQTVGCVAATNSTVQIIAWRLFGENPLVTTVSAFTKIEHSFGFDTTISAPDGTEKSNSRSSTSASSYNTTGTSAGGPARLVQFALADYSHCSIIFSGRYSPHIFSTASIHEGYNLLSAYVAPSSMSGSFLESEEVHKRRLNRRTTKNGYWPRFGNEIHLHSKTGTGVFSQICPHFDNDIVWTDRFAWGIGSGNEPLNINLFPPAPPVVTTKPERTLLGAGT